MQPSVTVVSVEGDADDRDLIRRGFMRCDGAKLVALQDADDLYAYLESPENPAPGLFLLDLNLIKENGIEIVRELRKRRDTSATPIIVFSGSADMDKVRACYEAGANAYIQKPVDYVEFVSAIETLFGFWIHLALLPRSPIPVPGGLR